jgi:hypothetical protein
LNSGGRLRRVLDCFFIFTSGFKYGFTLNEVSTIIGQDQLGGNEAGGRSIFYPAADTRRTKAAITPCFHP